MTTTAPYGSWPSPVTAADLAASTHAVVGGLFAGPGTDAAVWWLEHRPTEGGRYAVRQDGADGPEDVLPPPWNARSRVHEYGGGAWAVAVADEPVLVFVELTDQRLYRLGPDDDEPVPITPAGRGYRFGELTAHGAGVLAVRETHAVDERGHDVPGGVPVREVVAVPLDGSAAEDPGAIRVVVPHGSDFLAHPRFSPDGRSVAWVAWDHPRMPWDGTELRVAPLDADGCVVPGTWQALLGGPEESVLQPEWLDDTTIVATTDRSGWWNPHRVVLHDGGAPEITPLVTAEEEFAGPLWTLGSSWLLPLGAEHGDRLLVAHGRARTVLGLLDPVRGTVADLGGPLDSRVVLGDRRGSRVLLTGAGPRTPGGLWRLDVTTGKLTSVRSDVDAVPDAAWLPQAREVTVDGPRGPVHAFAYPPTHPDVVGPTDELPPYVVTVHGGPTAHVSGALDLLAAYLTSRGIGVLDVNYGGSTGYGRAYRERLRGTWGVVDVEDVAAAAAGLATHGLADPDRLAIRGGSAGGWTVLAALTTPGTPFAAGISRYGVADLRALAEDTHDFESRYLDGLVGPLPQAAATYAERAPINRVDRLDRPVLLLQGLDDPVVPPSQSERFRDAMAARACRTRTWRTRASRTGSGRPRRSCTRCRPS